MCTSKGQIYDKIGQQRPQIISFPVLNDKAEKIQAFANGAFKHSVTLIFKKQY